MNKKIIFLFLILASFLAGFILIYFLYPRNVMVDFEKAFVVKKTVDHTLEVILSSKEDLQHLCKDSTEMLYYTDVENSLDMFDFQNYDYLFVIGREADNIRHSPYIKHFVDMESHYSGIPVQVVCKGSLQNKVFVYRLPKKPKYRHLCC